MNILEIFKSRSLRRNQRWRWRLIALNGRLVANSGEGYSNKEIAKAQGVAVANGKYSNFELKEP